jgi:cytochrome P450
LARAELRCLLTAMVRTLDSIELAGPVQRKRSNFLHGLERLTVRVTPDRSIAGRPRD